MRLVSTEQCAAGFTKCKSVEDDEFVWPQLSSLAECKRMLVALQSMFRPKDTSCPPPAVCWQTGVAPEAPRVPALKCSRSGTSYSLSPINHVDTQLVANMWPASGMQAK